jgi:hypothetical protein
VTWVISAVPVAYWKVWVVVSPVMAIVCSSEAVPNDVPPGREGRQ